MQAFCPTPPRFSREALPAARRTIALRIAVVCWWLPLVIGIGIYGASEWVRATAPAGASFVPLHGNFAHQSHAFNALCVAGVFALGFGALLAAVGGLAVLIFMTSRWQIAADRQREVLRPAAVVAALLASNFPIALVIAQLALR